MPRAKVLVADEVWLATALLHRDHPEREDFSIAEILERARQEHVAGSGELRPGVQTHATQHCVASKKPDPNPYRMLHETERGRRRLFKQGDPAHPGRRNGKVTPNLDDLPTKYHQVLKWYWDQYARCGKADWAVDPILHLRGLGKEIWVAENPDEYVRKLREGWE